jgi:hypothetical protein
MKDYKLTRLISVLSIAALLLILALLVANVTSCAPITPQSAVAASTTQPIHDGTLYHPLPVDANPYGTVYTWDVLTVNGQEKWLECGYTFPLHPGEYILYHEQEYQISGINYKALTKSAVIMGN